MTVTQGAQRRNDRCRRENPRQHRDWRRRQGRGRQYRLLAFMQAAWGGDVTILASVAGRDLHLGRGLVVTHDNYAPLFRSGNPPGLISPEYGQIRPIKTPKAQ